jgi:protein gp37
VNRTKIPWCDLTWNLWTGCLHGCSYCYAKGIAQHFRPHNGEQFVWGMQTVDTAHAPGGHQTVYVAKDDSPPFPMGWAPTYYPRREHEPKTRRKPAFIFVNSMSDAFGDWVPDSWLDKLFGIMDDAPQHFYLLLSKNPARAADYLIARSRRLPGNIWMGTTVEDESRRWRLDDLARVPATVRFVSCEPLFGRLDLRPWPWLSWVIAGAETGPRARPADLDWFRSLRDQCQDLGAPYFLKAINAKHGHLLDGREWREFPR